MFRLNKRFQNLRIADLILIVAWTDNFIKCSSTDTELFLEPDKKIPHPEVCETEACKQIASEILGKMNLNVNPCDDFHGFVCGNFVKGAIIPEDQSHIDTMSQLKKKIQSQLKESIESGITKNDPKTFKVLKLYYNTCMDEELAEKSSEKEFLTLLEKLGGWPVLEGESWDESNFDWIETLQSFRKIGFSSNYFMSLIIQPNVKNNTRRIINIDQTSLGLSREYLLNGLKDKTVQAYFKYMVKVAKIFGADATDVKELKKSLKFEMKLAKISQSHSQRRNITLDVNHMTINKLETKYSYVRWLEYLNNYTYPYDKLKSTELVKVSAPRFLKKLGKLIDKTPTRVLANYAYWRVVAEAAETLSKRVRNAQRHFEAALNGISYKKPRWQECVDHVNRRLRLATDTLYVRRHFNQKNKDAVTEMILNLKKAFQRIILKNNWMEDVSKKKAMDILDDVLPLAADSDEFLHDKALDDYYERLKVNRGSFIRTMLNYNLFTQRQNWLNLRKPIPELDRTGFDSSANTDITINMAATLTSSLFNAEYPKYVNYAGIGFTVAREMADDLHDGLVDWSDAKTKNEYLKKTECMVEQYSNYTLNEVDLNIDGVLTLSENIADNGGLKEAYHAYDAWRKKNGQEPRLPGLESFTPQQMFWLSFGNVLCSKYRPQALSNLIVTNSMSPGPIRITGTTSNMPAFAADFNCLVGSFMNPVSKCSVW